MNADHSWIPNLSSLKVFLKMEGSNGSTTFSDTSGNSHDATANGDAQISTALFKSGKSSFLSDGNSNLTEDYLTIASHADLGFSTGDFAVSVWIYPTSLASSKVIYDSRPAGGGANSLYTNLFISNNGFVSFYMNGQTRITAKTALVVNKWNQVILTRVSGNTKIYINAMQDAEVYSDANDYSASIWKIGKLSYATSASYNFPGYMDDFMIWKGAGLTADQVSTLYKQQVYTYSGILSSRVMDYGSSISWDGFKWISTLPFGKELTGDANNSSTITSADSETHSDYSSLVGSSGSTSDDNLMSGIKGLWHLNGTIGATIADDDTISDSSGNGFTGSAKDGDATNDIRYDAGVFNESIYFDNSNNYIDVGDLALTTSYTISAWVNPATVKNYGAIFVKNDNSYNYGMYITSSRKARATTKTNSTNSAINSTSSLISNYWNHLVVTFDNSLVSANIKIYINGIVDATTATNTGTIPSITGSANIGKDPFALEI
jgi:hypothetical protein